MAWALEARGLAKRFGGTTILDDVTLEVPEGAFMLITGRSGSGKSTLFKLLAGLDRPTAGVVRIGGQDIGDLPDDALSDLRLHRLGLVFQSFNLLPDLTVLENVRLPLDIAGVSRRDAEPRARELLDVLGIASRSGEYPVTLSGGEQQRAAIARALVMRPAVLLADEPTGSLDRANAVNVLDAFREVNAKLGTTLLVITHDPLLMERVPLRLTLEDGRLTGSARPIARG